MTLIVPPPAWLLPLACALVSVLAATALALDLRRARTGRRLRRALARAEAAERELARRDEVGADRGQEERAPAAEWPEARAGSASNDETIEALARFAGGIAHDFNDQLTAILGHGQLLAERAAGREDDERISVGEIVRAAERARRLTEQLLAFSRPRVPRSDATHPAAPMPARIPEAHPVERDGPTPRRVLVVEDDDLVRPLLESVLRREGFEVLVAEDGARALELCEGVGGAVDLVLSDLQMPHMSGIELCGRLRERDPTLAVLFMSGYTDLETFHEEGAFGAANFLQKPFSSRELVRRVHAQLDEPASLRAPA